MEMYREEPAPPLIRMGFWVCLGLYGLSFVLPVDLNHTGGHGLGLFLYGCFGLMMAVFGSIHALTHPQAGAWTEIGQMWLAVLPWFANLVMWFALAQFRLENGRAALGKALAASLLASGFVLLPFMLDRTWGFSLSPAYLAWVGSMVILVIWSGFLARHERQWRSFDPSASFPVEQIQG